MIRCKNKFFFANLQKTHGNFRPLYQAKNDSKLYSLLKNCDCI